MKKVLFSIFVSILATASLAAAPQAVVFDFGGVMTREPNREAVVEFLCESLHLTPSEFEKANGHKKCAIKSGKTDEQFWQEFADKNGILLSADWSIRFASAMKDAIGANPEMYVLVNQLREKEIPVALLSNIDERLAKLIRAFGWYEPFSPCLLSCEIGVEKPDSKAFALLIERLEVPSADIVFIDDRPENVEGARKLGIDAILFESPDQIRLELQKRSLL